jgi:hypothetical protein
MFNGGQQADHLTAAIPNLDFQSSLLLEDFAPPTIQLEADNSEPTALVVIEQFSFGNPGAPTHGTHYGSATDDTDRGALGDNWAPFHSKLDWDIACWAKKHGLTSSAIADFLAIPEV